MTSQEPLRVLTFTSLYPNTEQPRQGLFVAERLRHLRASGRVQATVVAPVPWFPSRSPHFGRYASYARVPACEEQEGMSVHHPRWLAIPKIGMSAAPALMAAGARASVEALRERVDVIDAHYFYPDGVAAVALGRRLRKPVVVTARGTDLNTIPEHALPRRQILDAARAAAGLVTVSEALRDRLVELGVERGQVHVLRNGVDLARFAPAPDRDAVRSRLGVTGVVLLAVGNLVPEKDHALAIAALAKLADATLLVAGDGPLRAELEQRAARAGVASRVRFLGSVPQGALVDYYNAADALVLTSRREGMPNVVLEALACGTPVVATRVGGVPEVVAADVAGRLVDATDDGVADGARALVAAPPARAATRLYAERYGWDATTRGQIELFTRVVARAGNGESE
jgi:glycosyltransferase involved in cell wall biosynthesis